MNNIQVGSLVYVDNKGFVYEVFELSGDKAYISNCSANARVEVNVDRLTIAESAEEYSNNLKRYKEFFQEEKPAIEVGDYVRIKGNRFLMQVMEMEGDTATIGRKTTSVQASFNVSDLEKVEMPTMEEVGQLIDQKLKEGGIMMAGSPRNPTPWIMDKPVYTDKYGNTSEIEFKEYKRWRAEEGDVFYTVYTHGRIGEEVEYSEHADNMKYAMGNYFETKKLAFAHKEKLLAEQEFKDLVMKYNEGWEADWSDKSQYKFFLTYNHEAKNWFSPNSSTFQDTRQVYMSEKTAQKIIENHQDLLNKLI